MSQIDTKTAFISYVRVSTQQQGRSGLGLEAQRDAVQQFVAQRGGEIIAPEFVEIESGKRNDRPMLEAALKRCRLTGATLVVAKLDRLSRNAAFLLTLRDSGVAFIAADLPEANTMTVGVMAVVAQHEAEAISKRTKEALARSRHRRKRIWDEAQANGYPPPIGPLGGLRAKAPDISKFAEAALRAVKGKAAASAEERREVFAALVDEKLSLNAMAHRLNETQIKTANRCRWTATAVKRTLSRLSAPAA